MRYDVLKLLFNGTFLFYERVSSIEILFKCRFATFRKTLKNRFRLVVALARRNTSQFSVKKHKKKNKKRYALHNTPLLMQVANRFCYNYYNINCMPWNDLRRFFVMIRNVIKRRRIPVGTTTPIVNTSYLIFNLLPVCFLFIFFFSRTIITIIVYYA